MRFLNMFRHRDRVSQGKQRARRSTTRLSLEALDDRVLLSTITVNSLADSGKGTLRAAIVQADATPPSQNPSNWPVISFDFSQLNPVPATYTIALKSALPAVTADHVTIGSDPGFHPVIDGSGAGNITGLTILGHDCTLANFTVENCSTAGINVEGQNTSFTSKVDVQDCSNVGFLVQASHTLLSGVTAGGDNCTSSSFPPKFGPPLGNGIGIEVINAQDVSILGGSTISFNTSDGIRVIDSELVNIGYHVGTDPGDFPIPTIIQNNGADGVRVTGSLTPGTTNLFTTNIANAEIGGNTGNGVHLVGSSGNIIGGIVNDANKTALTWTGYGKDWPEGYSQAGNGGDGILIESSHGTACQNNTISLVSIAGNNGNGIRITGTGASENTVQDNYVGQYFGPTNDVYEVPQFLNQGNLLDGVKIEAGAHDNTIGGQGLFIDGNPNSGAGNYIGNNGGDGVGIGGPGTTNNVVQGNMIGWGIAEFGAASGAVTLGPNSGNGVRIANGATLNSVGGVGGTAPKTGFGNLIAENKQSGVDIDGTGTSSNLVYGNIIGADPTGTKALPNFRGVFLEDYASANHIGLALEGTGRTLGNLISGNFSQGVLIANASSNFVQANAIGTNIKENGPLPNGVQGVLITGGSTGNYIGGADNVSKVTLAGNVISGNGLSGVALDGAFVTNNEVQGNLIGTDAFAIKAVPNGTVGVYMTDSAYNNTIGGASSAQGNVIAGNTQDGVLAQGSAHNDTVENNFIGLSPLGFAIGNGGNGVTLESDEVTVTQNVISGNLVDGVAIGGSLNAVQGNMIGTNAGGTSAIPNLLDGVYMNVLSGTGGNFIGGISPNATNVISGNLLNGIHVAGNGTGNVFMGNRIGTDGTGAAFVPNGLDGVLVDNAFDYTIGGVGANVANVISGNKQNGVEITGTSAENDAVIGNLIGTDPTGKLAVGNGASGVLITKGASYNTVGGTVANQGNLISGNDDDGVVIEGSVDITGGGLPHDNDIYGNRIGTDTSGMVALPNAAAGVEVLLANANHVGGGASGMGNLISGNGSNGVVITARASGNFVQGDLIGTRVDGTHALANQGNGVAISNSTLTTVGGTPTPTSTPGNIISGNKLSGLVIGGPGATLNTVQGNDIGTTRNAAAPLGNGQDGIDILFGANANTAGGVGGVGAGEPGNFISANKGDGIHIDGMGTNNNLVLGNVIGAYATGLTGNGNGGNGVSVSDGAQGDAVGGLTAKSGNVIAYNGGAGVAIGHDINDVNTISDPVLSNSIFSNAGQGIDLASDGVTQNSPGPHTGPNRLLSTPVIQSATYNGATGTLVLELSLSSAVPGPFTIQVFASSAPGAGFHGQGTTLLANVPFSGSGTITVTLQVPASINGQYLSATATDSSLDTSEFSKDYQVL